MKIHTIALETSAPTLKDCPTWTLPEIAFVGRSNVGKSSLINCLSGRKNIARTSNTPGKTRLMNFYRVNDAQLAFVDLPGYGYAKVSKTTQAQWQKHLEAYLQRRSNLVLVVALVDARHGLQANDRGMLSWLGDHECPTAVVLTKTDKISRNAVIKVRQETATALSVTPEDILTISAETGQGKAAFLDFLADYLAQERPKC